MELYNGDCLEVMKSIHEGRDFIGIEKDAEYFRIAKMRLEQEQEAGQQLSLL